MKKRRPSVFFLMVALLLMGCSETSNQKNDVIQLVKVFHIENPEDVIERSFPGIVEASEKADLSFLVSGQLIEFSVKEGDQVEQGQVIAKLDPIDYEIAVAEAESRAAFARVDLERTKKLLEKQFASQQQYDANKAVDDVAQAKLLLAQQHLKDTQLVVPFSGEVAKKYVENFQNIQAKKPILRLQNRKIIDVKVQIPESLLIRSDQLKNGIFKAEFETVSSLRYEAKVKEISTQANPETQSYSVTFTLANPKDLNVFPGMTAIIHTKFQFPKDTKEKIYIIPISSVFSDEKGISYVWLILPSTHRLKKQEVQISRLVGEGVMVTEGLSPGQDIVAAGAEFVKADMKVKPLKKSGD
ncbi:MAG: efflux RND transporter periplasmic adaptor subunit [Alphaproteobacteria bacterium]|nr:efflux RND transporter periplasmic adaptor subunit [Alphaproteobacteria bacterium]